MRYLTTPTPLRWLRGGILMAVDVVDASVRAEALDPRRSYIVQAPAGSGKTELLTRRILNLLAEVNEPEEILAITFTRKAAAEMRQRVVQTLQAAYEQTPITDDYQHEGRELAQRVLSRDKTQNWQLLDNPARMGIQTIDSLCSVLTRQLPVTSNFGAEPRVLEDAAQLWMKAAQRAIDENLQPTGLGHTSLNKLLKHLDNNADRLHRLLSDMLANRDQWLRHNGQVSSREQMEADLTEFVDEQFQALNRVLPDGLLEPLVPLLKHSSTCLSALGIAHSITRHADIAEIPAPAFDSAVIWQLLSDILLTKEGKIRKSVTKNIGFPVSAADAKQLGLDVEDLRERKSEFQELLQIASENDVFASLLHAIRNMPITGYTDEQWEIMGCLLDLLRLAVAELHLVFAEAGQVDFSEIAIRAARALGDEDAPTDLALALDYRLKHILVDEFQDTSISQFRLFSQLVAGWEPDDGRTFFAVGDPMQSIYRFRDAEVSLFLQASKHGVGNVALDPLKLSVNFRSDPAIVDWCNQTFSNVFPSHTNLSTGAITYSSSIANKAAAPRAGQRFHAFVDDDRAEQGQWVADLVEAALDQGSDESGNIAILVRSKSHLTEIFTALQQRKIGYQAIDIETLGDRLVVRDIVSLCRALQHPQDRLHWLAVLRGPACGLLLSDLTTLVGHEPVSTVWSLMQNPTVVEQLSDDGQRRLRRVIAVLTPAIERALREPLVAWVEACWLALGGPASCAGDVDLLAADACFRELARIEEQGLLWEAKFIDRRLDRLFAPAQSGTVRVQIMTIHKSKGLEFDTVILPGLGRKPRGDQSQLLNWFESYDDDSTGSRLLLAPILEPNQSGRSEPILDMIKSLQKRKSDNELLRLLYVAATRAKRHLHLIGHVKRKADGELSKPPTNSLLSPLWTLLQDQFSDLKTPDDVPGSADLVAPILKRVVTDWSLPDFKPDWVSPVYPDVEPMADPDSPEFTLEYAWAGTAARHVGSVVHRQLQRFAEEGLSQWSVKRVSELTDFYRSRLKASGVSADQLDVATQSVGAALTNVLSDERALWILDHQHQEAASELRLTGLSSGQLANRIIDRTFVDDNDIRWIIDFKTGAHSGGRINEFIEREWERYRPQLEDYAAIMRETEEREIRLGLYFPLHSHWREWSANENGRL